MNQKSNQKKDAQWFNSLESDSNSFVPYNTKKGEAEGVEASHY